MSSLINKLRQLGHIIFTLACIIGTKHASAQLANFQSVYFQNQYLANPAMAGLDKGLNLNLGYQQQWTTVPGGPTLQHITADYNAGNKVGIGVNISNDRAGLISRTRIMGTYAYHLQMNQKEDKLSFGLSLGINDTYIDNSKVVGDQGDASVQNLNQRNVYVDGDFGIAYTTKKLNIQASIPNLKDVFFKNGGENLDVDRSTFFTALSYNIPISNEYNSFTIEPKVAFRGIKGFDNIFDAGIKLDMTAYNFDISAMYHSNQSATLAFGLNLDKMGLLFAYTNNNGPLRTYAANTFEFGVKLKMFNK